MVHVHWSVATWPFKTRLPSVSYQVLTRWMSPCHCHKIMQLHSDLRQSGWSTFPSGFPVCSPIGLSHGPATANIYLHCLMMPKSTFSMFTLRRRIPTPGSSAAKSILRVFPCQVMAHLLQLLLAHRSHFGTLRRTRKFRVIFTTRLGLHVWLSRQTTTL